MQPRLLLFIQLIGLDYEKNQLLAIVTLLVMAQATLSTDDFSQFETADSRDSSKWDDLSKIATLNTFKSYVIQVSRSLAAILQKSSGRHSSVKLQNILD